MAEQQMSTRQLTVCRDANGAEVGPAAKNLGVRVRVPICPNGKPSDHGEIPESD